MILSKQINRLQVYFSGKISGKKFIPGIAWFFILLVLICLPGDDLPKADWWLDKIFFDKWVHTGLFGMLALLFSAPVFGSHLSGDRKTTYVIIIAIAAITWGITTEGIQYAFIPGRSFDLYDWMADTVGIILGILVSRYLFLNPGEP